MSNVQKILHAVFMVHTHANQALAKIQPGRGYGAVRLRPPFFARGSLFRVFCVSIPCSSFPVWRSVSILAPHASGKHHENHFYGIWHSLLSQRLAELEQLVAESEAVTSGAKIRAAAAKIQAEAVAAKAARAAAAAEEAKSAAVELEAAVGRAGAAVAAAAPSEAVSKKGGIKSFVNSTATMTGSSRSGLAPPALSTAGVLNGNSLTSINMPRQKNPPQSVKPTGQFRAARHNDDEDAWPLKDDPEKAAEVAAASIIKAASVQKKPRMLNAPKNTASKRPGAKGRGQVHSTGAANNQTVVAGDHKKWESFRTRVKGSAHLQNGEFLHGGFKIRGLSAVSAMKAGTEVLRVPAALVMSKANPALQNFFTGLSFKESSDPTWKLVSFVAAERRLGDRSQWGPYLAHLPKLSDFKAFHPLWASEDLLQLFAPLPVLHDVREYRRRARTQWREWQSFSLVLKQKLADGAKTDQQTEALRKAALRMTEEDIQWAFTVVLTRGFGTPQGSALAPVADDLNTDSPFKLNVQWHGQEDGSVMLATTASVSKGDELLTSYSAGPRNNDDFASSFGFALANNADTVGKLAPRACNSMAKDVKSRYGSKGLEHSDRCMAPKTERQPAVFCTLLALAKEHCPWAKFD
eukprot:gnl/MRDRNA2_/MRDRNA2_34103_c0_seq1.p1 gnl/MRDRNA2_/MRDRNA2_34103_c0~~gnl/MRDRNA2_/MRDRNA2_34103_c0_seq1.p1  ORF type:complete len:635 (-),score=137.41 gnl/MRDRNA2_/MRDRNA2_34103_c0_seq1:114-2018(-)